MEQYLWLVLAVLLFVIEAATVSLVSIWVGLGAIAAFIAAMFGADLFTQCIIASVFSLILIIFTRPFAKKILKVRNVKTNANSNIGKIGIVIVKIENDKGNGRVNVAGLDWLARSEDDIVIEEDEKVLIKAIEGATLIVEKLI